MQLYTIDTGHFKLDGGAMFGVVPKSLWQKLNPADENNMCSWAMRCLLAVEGSKAMLIDTGIGTKQSDKFFGFYYLHGEGNLHTSLEAVGVSADAVTDVFLTHLHFDHVGGAVTRVGEKLLPTFGAAAYHSNAAHWQWAVKPNPREKASFLTENIQPLAEAGVLSLHHAPDTGFVQMPEVFLDLEVMVVDGHTEKQMLPILPYKGRKVAFVADLIPSSGHIALPYIMAYDMRPLLTLAEKEMLLGRAADEGWVLFFEHDPVVECATVKRTEKGIVLDQTFKLSEL